MSHYLTSSIFTYLHEYTHAHTHMLMPAHMHAHVQILRHKYTGAHLLLGSHIPATFRWVVYSLVLPGSLFFIPFSSSAWLGKGVHLCLFQEDNLKQPRQNKTQPMLPQSILLSVAVAAASPAADPQPASQSGAIFKLHHTSGSVQTRPGAKQLQCFLQQPLSSTLKLPASMLP